MAKWIPVKRDADEKGQRVVRADRVTEVVILDPKRVQLRADGQWFLWMGTSADFAVLMATLEIGDLG